MQEQAVPDVFQTHRKRKKKTAISPKKKEKSKDINPNTTTIQKTKKKKKTKKGGLWGEFIFDFKMTEGKLLRLLSK